MICGALNTLVDVACWKGRLPEEEGGGLETGVLIVCCMYETGGDKEEVQSA